ncbi:transposase [bacterium]|nr:transposase [bacterium]
MVAIEATDPLPLFRFLVSCACHTAPWRRSPVLIAVSNGACSDAYEGLNRKVNVVTRKAYGFRSEEVYRIALFYTLGGLPEPPATHKYC